MKSLPPKSQTFTFFIWVASKTIGMIWKLPHHELISACILCFGLGLLVEDIFNKNSWVRSLIQYFRRLFAVNSTNIIPKSNATHEWFEVTLDIEFIQSAKNAILIFEIDSAVNVPHAREKFILETKNLPRIEAHQKERYVLAIIAGKSKNASPAGYNSWGEKLRLSGDVENMKSLSDKSFIKVVCRCGWRKQEETIFLNIANTNSDVRGWTLGPYSEFITIESK